MIWGTIRGQMLISRVRDLLMKLVDQDGQEVQKFTQKLKFCHCFLKTNTKAP